MADFILQIIESLDELADRLQPTSYIRMGSVLHQVLHSLAGTVDLISNLQTISAAQLIQQFNVGLRGLLASK
ncbi:hypothetical protein D3C87_1443370 [compost metagenome]